MTSMNLTLTLIAQTAFSHGTPTPELNIPGSDSTSYSCWNYDRTGFAERTGIADARMQKLTDVKPCQMTTWNLRSREQRATAS